MKAAILVLSIFSFDPTSWTLTVDRFRVTWDECLASREVIAHSPRRQNVRPFVYCDDSPEAFAEAQRHG